MTSRSQTKKVDMTEEVIIFTFYISLKICYTIVDRAHHASGGNVLRTMVGLFLCYKKTDHLTMTGFLFRTAPKD